jgi:hypothetical protein
MSDRLVCIFEAEPINLNACDELSVGEPANDRPGVTSRVIWKKSDEPELNRIDYVEYTTPHPSKDLH